MPNGDDLFIVIVTHNRLEYTKRTVKSFLQTVPQANIIIFDNASSEAGFRDYLDEIDEDENKRISCVVSKINYGWGSAVNKSIKAIFETIAEGNFEPKYILISNNDVEYYPGWYEKCVAAYDKFPLIGILGVWQHTAHQVLMADENLVVKDNMPAVGWLLKPKVIEDIGAFPEHGPCETKGGNGEDTEYCIRAQQKGYYVACLPEDQAWHLDGY